MNREQAKELIRSTFESPFDKWKFVVFIKNLLKTYDDTKAFQARGYVKHSFKQVTNVIKTYERIGSYSDSQNKKIDILIVYLEKKNSLDKARTTLRNFVARYLKDRGEKDASLVAFVSPDEEDWRFSLVKMDYRFDETPSGKIKVKEEFTPARRWSFLVGENEKTHTAQSKFLKILENDELRPTLEDIEQAFNVEVVTKEFFQKYRDLFIKTKVELDKVVKRDLKIKQEFESKNINTVDFAKKLLGQIVFLFYLQKKGWFGVEKRKTWGTGPKDFIRRLFNREFGGYKNFFNDILEPLFYEALRTDRSSDDHYYSRFNCKIPFLNGGLFDPINNYNWVDIDIFLPDELFSNTNKTKEGDIGDGILDVFDRYNFTANEEEPLEKEVALDPEMLGKIYEKLNAIRQDNFDEYEEVLKSGKKGEETKFNKEYGVYYTPREIVHYMCQQSLIYYLENELSGKESREDIEELVKYGELFTENEATALVKEQQIKEGIMKSSEYEFKLPKSIIENAEVIDKFLSDIKVCDPAVGSGAFPIGMMHEVVKLRNLLSIYTGKQINPYDLKRHCIENSLYGVDIDPGAVEICKLRFWLSMIVDEEDFYNIKPLPNLDYKIARGNSLLGVEKDLFNQQAFAKLEELKPQYFNETNPTKKQQLKTEIDKLIYEITKGHKEFDFEVYFSEVFHQKKGFDVVIANPPYDVYQGNRKNEIEVMKKYPIYDKASGGKLNAYKLFLAKSIELQKSQGILCEIFQNSFLADSSATKIRKYFIENQRIFQIDSFPERDDTKRRVFEDVKMSVCVLFSENTRHNEYSFQLNIWEDKSMDFSKSIILNNLDVLNFDLENSTIPSINQNEIEILRKVSCRTRLKQFAKCYEGEINLTFHKKYLKKEKTHNSRMIKGAAVQKWLIKEKMSQGEIEYLDHTSYLKENQGNKSQHFKVKRIVMQGITGVDEKYRLKMTIIEPKIFCGNSVNYILIEDNNITYEYLLSLLNSHLTNWYFKIFSTNSNVNGYEVDNFPIPKVSLDEQQPFIDLVDKILAITKVTQPSKLRNNHKQDACDTLQAKVKESERHIDQLVYKLYGLTEDEIKIIEGRVV